MEFQQTPKKYIYMKKVQKSMSREDLWENVQFILKNLKVPQIALKAAQISFLKKC